MRQIKKSVLMLMVSMILSSFTWADHEPAHINVKMPELSPKAVKGQEVFNVNCAGCHGNNGEGGSGGPPLIHDIYNPGHHSNRAFIQAMQNGTRSHHWSFGDMPAQKQMGIVDMMVVIKYIREVQVANGIKTKTHNM